MESNKILSSLCYFSIFFAAFLFPIVVYFVTQDFKIKNHAKRAFFSHLLPFLTVALIIVFSFFSINHTNGSVGLAFVGIALGIIINVVVVIWNIIQGIKVLTHSDY